MGTWKKARPARLRVVEYFLIVEEGDGRVRRKLDQFGDLLGLVVGRFNEVSNDLNTCWTR